MSRESVQRFCDNDMRTKRNLKRERESHKIAKRFKQFLRRQMMTSAAPIAGAALVLTHPP
jgi:hypothetical protein